MTSPDPAASTVCVCPRPDAVFEWFADQGIAYLLCCDTRALVTRTADGGIQRQPQGS